ncbi:flagellar P-ring protein [Planctopirus limnophila DSM 3776]|uniref:Flagellar P-ring protein n=1 Tax=Planctopirus limnophila (strain ATCC 43296 / DSM 3776 / IFAM 1008 / Mu 290) TaxID=521674 RepID=D5SU18_PLAL2|nr:flagellar basal body P-ring protein FlgI [Planctopirus limnophila]ADG67003.1 flagellar P-ring protein [Planctopirus limnophila DSM 3776]
MISGHRFCWSLIVLLATTGFCATHMAMNPFKFGKSEKSKAASESKSEEEIEDEFATKTETPLIGTYASFAGLEPVILEGVGLVVGLNGTGGDPAPSQFRSLLLEDMKRRNVPNPNQILASPNTALVVIKAYLPPLIEKGATIDVEVKIPESAQATSLEGGYLLDCDLTEHAFVPGRGVLEGHTFAKAKGPILTSSVLGGSKSEVELQKRMGRVLGGATVLRERDLAIFLRNDVRSVRNSSRIAEAIGIRFHDYDKSGIKVSMAEAKTDQKIILKIHPTYRENYPRYLQVIRSIAFRETTVTRRVRLQKLAKDIFEPDKAESASLQLEAVGKDAIPTLKGALEAPLLECQFYAAVALAYLGDTSGVDVLEKCVREEPAFRVFALSALSTIEDAESYVKLRELMSEPTAETRYGAFRAMWTASREEPFIRGIPLKDKQYQLHVLKTTGQPMTHVTLRTRPEIVLFGADQEFIAPMYATAGRGIMVTIPPGSRTVSVAKFAVGQADERKETSLKVADVIYAAAEMGASYPDIVQLLVQANRQQNLPGEFAMDALPKAGRFYSRPDADGSLPASRKARVGRENLSPNMFPISPEKAIGEESDPLALKTDAESLKAVSQKPDASEKSLADKNAEPSMASVKTDGSEKKPASRKTPEKSSEKNEPNSGLPSQSEPDDSPRAEKKSSSKPTADRSAADDEPDSSSEKIQSRWLPAFKRTPVK